MLKGDSNYPRPIILFDGICNLCNSTINFIIEHDKKKIFLFSTLQSEFGNQIVNQFFLSQAKYNTVILLFESSVYLRSEAFLKIIKILGFPWLLLAILRIIPTKLLDSIYLFISVKRYSWFGKRDNCMIPDDSIKSRFL